MKKLLFLIGLVSLFACNRENENLGVNENQPNTLKNISSRSGDIGALPIEILPNNLNCEIGEELSPLDDLPDGVPLGLDVTAQYNYPSSAGTVSLPELIIQYLADQGFSKHKEVLFDNNSDLSSYNDNNFFHREFTISESKSSIPEDGNYAEFGVFNFNSNMNRNDASTIVKNAYYQIINGSQYPITGNSILDIKIFYEDVSCPDNELDRRNLKIQVVYKPGGVIIFPPVIGHTP